VMLIFTKLFTNCHKPLMGRSPLPLWAEESTQIIIKKGLKSEQLEVDMHGK
jgi:hypothetical protein